MSASERADLDNLIVAYEAADLAENSAEWFTLQALRLRALALDGRAASEPALPLPEPDMHRHDGLGSHRVAQHHRPHDFAAPQGGEG